VCNISVKVKKLPAAIENGR